MSGVRAPGGYWTMLTTGFVHGDTSIDGKGIDTDKNSVYQSDCLRSTSWHK
jgi:hypothetical protein